MDKRAHAVLLRGVNLGKHNKVPMPALRKALTAQGFEQVATLFQSGNVVVVDGRSGPAVADTVRTLVREEFGVDVPCLAVDRSALGEVVSACPLPEQAASNGKYFNVVFLSEPVRKKHLAAWDPREIDPENIHVASRAIYQWCPTGYHLAPQLLPKVEKVWQITGTVRNWNTTVKLLEMVEAADAA
jgi:uncharacterized protein (DUF1697 family)